VAEIKGVVDIKISAVFLILFGESGGLRKRTLPAHLVPSASARCGHA
jgi:hypothetical protein